MVSAKAAEKWPGNNIPSFRNNKPLQQELTTFARELAKDYSMDGFDEDAIRQHIKDCLRERRRQVNHGYDYENVIYTYMPVLMSLYSKQLHAHILYYYFIHAT